VVILTAMLACLPDAGPSPLTLDWDRFVEIPATTFELGHLDAEPGDYGQRWKENEFPRHEVSLSAFAIQVTEVTVEDWVLFLDSDPALPPVHHHPLQPVSWDGGFFTADADQWAWPARYVSWYDAAAYCGLLGGRLPTEAEWELAAKGTDTDDRRWPWGNDGPSCELAVYFTDRTLCQSEPATVGSRSPQGDSQWGLADMAGNVAEWTVDRYGRYEDGDITDPDGPQEGELRVLRGGGFRTTDNGIRTLSRVGARPADRSEGVGFRCAVDL
jgi:iron(II)-dependent oxidoreductase